MCGSTSPWEAGPTFPTVMMIISIGINPCFGCNILTFRGVKKKVKKKKSKTEKAFSYLFIFLVGGIKHLLIIPRDYITYEDLALNDNINP